MGLDLSSWLLQDTCCGSRSQQDICCGSRSQQDICCGSRSQQGTVDCCRTPAVGLDLSRTSAVGLHLSRTLLIVAGHLLWVYISAAHCVLQDTCCGSRSQQQIVAGHLLWVSNSAGHCWLLQDTWTTLTAWPSRWTLWLGRSSRCTDRATQRLGCRNSWR